MRPTRVSDVMTKNVYTLMEEDNLVDVRERMEELGFRHVPVVDEGKLVGLVTHRDMLRVSASAFEAYGEAHSRAIGETYFVADLMQRDLVTAGPDMPLVEAAAVILDRKLGCLPVVDEEGTLLGIVTESDFVRLALQLLKESS